MLFVGIDPGVNGGLAALDEKGVPILVTAFRPTGKEFDTGRLSDILTDLRVSDAASNRMHVALEKVAARPGQGVVSMFSFGTTFGKIQGVLTAKQIPFELIRPQEWMGVMLVNEPKDMKKDRAKNAASKLFPDVRLYATERCHTIHSGMADAILLAEYVRRKYRGA